MTMSSDPFKFTTDAPGAISFTRAELFEQAGLAALGLLDRDEHEAYERALREQPLEVREQVLREQARFAESEELRAKVEPDASLKERVLDRVHAAIVQRVINAEATENGARPTNNGWRIASVSLLAACVALGAIAFTTYQTNSNMRSQLESNAVATGSVSVEEMLFDTSVKRYALLPASQTENVSAQATLFVKESTNEARLVYRGLPRVEGSTYRIVVIDEEGSVTRELAQFEGTPQRDSIKLPAPAPRTRVAIVLMPNGEVSAGSKPQALLAATV
jgi:anti-sigma-K factor RskA